MTATVLLIRHAAHSHLGNILSGRTPGIALSDQGEAQATALAGRLAREPLDLVHTSPVQRACETAAAIAVLRPDLPIQTVPALDELDFGEWSGRAFAELEGDPRWHSWNERRSAAPAPSGESMAAAQQRAWRHVEATARSHPGCTLAMVTHCDVIRAVVAQVLGLTLDHVHRFDIAAASVSRLAVGDWGAKVVSLNERFDG